MSAGCAGLVPFHATAAEIARVKVPVLIVQGGRDIQISEDDARALKAAHPAAKLVVIPAANRGGVTAGHKVRQLGAAETAPEARG